MRSRYIALVAVTLLLLLAEAIAPLGAAAAARAHAAAPPVMPLPEYIIWASVDGGHGRVSPEGLVLAAAGSSPTFVFAPDARYHVDSVTVDGVPVVLNGWNSYTFPPLAANHSLAVSFAPDGGPSAFFTVTPRVSGGHGSVTPASAQVVPYGATPTFFFSPEAGYAVAEVRVDGAMVAVSATASYTFPPVVADHTLTVRFAPLEGTLTTRAPSPATAKRWRIAALDYEVDQAVQRGTADVTIRITDGRGRVVKTLERFFVTLNVPHKARFLCLLPKGFYTFTVSARTSSGAVSVGDAWNTLTVQ